MSQRLVAGHQLPAGQHHQVHGTLRRAVRRSPLFVRRRRWPDIAEHKRCALWFASVSYRVNTALDLRLAYFYWNIKQLALSNSIAPINPANLQQVSFVADYALSKRTDFHLTAA